MISSADEFRKLRLSDDPAEYRRATYEPAPESVWQEVLRRYPDLHFWVAQNKTVPLSVLRVLAEDPDATTRSMVARKRKLTPDILLVLSGDANDAVRMAVARHRNTPECVLRQLAEDPWDDTRQVAQQRLRSSAP